MSRANRTRRRGSDTLAIVLVVLLCIAFIVWGAGQGGKMLFPQKYTELIEFYAEENDLPPELVYAVVYCESEFDPNAVSSVGACGLMQLMEPTFDWVKDRLEGEEDTQYEDLFDPETNLKYGCRLLGLLVQEYKTVPNALCAYHAGWGKAKEWLEDPQCTPDGKNIENIPYVD
ncbi:MAG: lytic transglycosylase domain-containing protein, partial [Oscillospiraceae bacterium]|nr:lytic transglycosylase domain-containing protein [Oscillospiraceae bacterium]